MKISEMTNDQATTALVRLSGPISNICDDEEMLALIDEVQGMKNVKNVPVIKTVAKLIPKFVTFGLAKHKRDIYEIVGALLMESTAKVAQMNFIQTVNAVKDSYDEVLASFFTPSGALKKNTAE